MASKIEEARKLQFSTGGTTPSMQDIEATPNGRDLSRAGRADATTRNRIYKSESEADLMATIEAARARRNIEVVDNRTRDLRISAAEIIKVANRRLKVVRRARNQGTTVAEQERIAREAYNIGFKEQNVREQRRIEAEKVAFERGQGRLASDQTFRTESGSVVTVKQGARASENQALRAAARVEAEREFAKDPSNVASSVSGGVIGTSISGFNFFDPKVRESVRGAAESGLFLTAGGIFSSAGQEGIGGFSAVSQKDLVFRGESLDVQPFPGERTRTYFRTEEGELKVIVRPETGIGKGIRSFGQRLRDSSLYVYETTPKGGFRSELAREGFTIGSKLSTPGTADVALGQFIALPILGYGAQQGVGLTKSVIATRAPALLPGAKLLGAVGGAAVGGAAAFDIATSPGERIQKTAQLGLIAGGYKYGTSRTITNVRSDISFIKPSVKQSGNLVVSKGVATTPVSYTENIGGYGFSQRGSINTRFTTGTFLTGGRSPSFGVASSKLVTPGGNTLRGFSFSTGGFSPSTNVLALQSPFSGRGQISRTVQEPFGRVSIGQINTRLTPGRNIGDNSVISLTGVSGGSGRTNNPFRPNIPFRGSSLPKNIDFAGGTLFRQTDLTGFVSPAKELSPRIEQNFVFRVGGKLLNPPGRSGGGIGGGGIGRRGSFSSSISRPFSDTGTSFGSISPSGLGSPIGSVKPSGAVLGTPRSLPIGFVSPSIGVRSIPLGLTPSVALSPFSNRSGSSGIALTPFSGRGISLSPSTSRSRVSPLTSSTSIAGSDSISDFFGVSTTSSVSGVDSLSRSIPDTISTPGITTPVPPSTIKPPSFVPLGLPFLGSGLGLPRGRRVRQTGRATRTGFTLSLEAIEGRSLFGLSGGRLRTSKTPRLGLSGLEIRQRGGKTRRKKKTQRRRKK